MMSWGMAGALYALHNNIMTWFIVRLLLVPRKAAVRGWVHGRLKREPQTRNENPKVIHGKFLFEEKSKILPTHAA